jgi:YYY domain-containing protein
MLKVPYIRSRYWVYDLLLVLVLLAAAALRFTGIYWDEDQHLHPDERFLTGVVASLEPVHSLSEYFDTANSTLNPNNRGSDFFVYGTLPVFMVRYAAEWIGQTGYGQVQLVGRALSAVADLGVILIVYLIAARLFDRRVALLAAIFSAFSVMQIQQSHFWTVDNFVNFFTILAVYFAIRVATPDRDSQKIPFNPFDYLGFGLALGCAMASKVNIVLVSLTLPVAIGIRLWSLPTGRRNKQLGPSIIWLIVAAFLSLIVFRVFQPYAFVGLGLNPHWVDTMKQLSAQVNGDADWPPSMQWARRPLWFGFENILRWGLGWPLGLVSWGGFAWAGWRIYKGDWQRPAVILWGWGLIYFVWQSTAFNPTMRYFLPLYPVLAVFAAWGIISLWDAGARRAKQIRWQRFLRPAAGLVGAVAVLGAGLWAVAFVQIYRQPMARIAAARWIYDNVPGPITLTVADDQGVSHQPLSVPYYYLLDSDTPYFTGFGAHSVGQLTEIDFKYLLAPLRITLTAGDAGEIPIADLNQLVDLPSLQPGSETQIVFTLPSGPLVDPLSSYHLQINLPAGEGQLVLESAELRSSQAPDDVGQQILSDPQPLEMGQVFPLDFNLPQGISPDQIVLQLRTESVLHFSPLAFHLQISAAQDMSSPLVDVIFRATPGANPAAAGNAASIPLSQPAALNQNQTYYLQLSLRSPGVVSLLGSAVANESSWDDGLPLRIDGYDGFGGIYQGNLNFEMYWDEDASKIQRFENTLDNSEYIFITSSRQWGSLPRIPERFPLVVAYYRALLGCPVEKSIDWCYENAQIGSFQGQLGFDLVQVFVNEPRLGNFQINDQGAEEAFTVYDHPKVFILKKNADYDPQRVASLLGAVPVEQSVHVTPKHATGRIPPNLMLPADRLEQQQAGGTWSELFNRASFVNLSPWLSLVVWYLALAALGIAVYPLVRFALPGLKDGGYPFARLAGLLLLSYFAWMGGSLGLTFSRSWLAFFFALLVALGALAAKLQWPAIKQEWKTKRAQFLRVELLFFVFFFIMLVVRYANPDLWHPSFGGEKPMDFSYFNAVLKSSSFPPYDPWFAGGYINYYYYGFVLVGSLVKLLGIIPAVAYNLILPSLFAMLALGTYSVAWNLWSAWKSSEGKGNLISADSVGIIAAVAILLLGNLGSLQMIFQGYMQLGAQGVALDSGGFLAHLGWTLRGFLMSMQGQRLPFGLGSWYWNPTRIFPAPGESSPITEFPLFTFTYADLHAHMIALPVTVLGLGWALSAVLSRAWEKARSWLQVGWSFAFGAIVLGSLRPINTWDLPTYLAIAALAVGYTILRYCPRRKAAGSKSRAPILWALGGVGAIALLSMLAYLPFNWWYRQGYGSVRIWDGIHVSYGPYLVHWGIFLFFIITWMIWETRQWLASTPLSSFRKLEPYIWVLSFALLSILGTLFYLRFLGVHIGWLLVPLIIWAGLLLIRPKQDEAKRLILFFIGTGLFLTLMVEVIVLNGDISRMNTVFKFYMQAWTLLAISAAFAAAWTWQALRQWLPGWRGLWQLLAAILLACGGLFLLLGVTAKMRDRMSTEAPHTLDGMAYMQSSVYYDKDQALDLNQDYQAIIWMQDHVQGSPVIVEAYTDEYRWGARFAINTGLPAVVGWNFHQRQQREFVPGNNIWARVGEVNEFYTTTDLALVHNFLNTYRVKYIIVGQLERAYYPGPGLDKFAQQDGVLWHAVYRQGDTVIYEVLDSTLTQE